MEDGGKYESKYKGWDALIFAEAQALTSAEEYPDEEYLDMSKSSSLKQKNTGYYINIINVCLCASQKERCLCVHLSVSRATKGFSSGLWSKDE